MEFWIQLAEWLAALGIGMTAVGWLVRSLFSQLLSKDLEAFKAELHRIAIEHQARFFNLHERRVEAIDGLYRRLVQAQNAFMALGGGILTRDETYDERLDAAGSAGRDLLEFFSANRLYYDAEVINGFGAINNVLSSAWATFVFERRDQVDSPIPPHERERFIKVWREARDGVNEKVPILIDELEGNMREILGASPRRVLQPRGTPGDSSDA